MVSPTPCRPILRYDLFSTDAMVHWSYFVDIFRDEAIGTYPQLYADLVAKMGAYVTSYEEAFISGHWSLWNGNNWTPVLSKGVMHWAVVFWWVVHVLCLLGVPSVRVSLCQSLCRVLC